MKWAFGIRRKVSAALLLAVIFVLVFVKNMVDSNHVTELGNSFSSVYEDRLMVESYIYRLSEHLFRKKIMIDTCGNHVTARFIKPLIDGHSKAIENIIGDYEKTNLTEVETTYFNLLKENVQTLVSLEKEYLQTADPEAMTSAKMAIDKQFTEASANLGHLSAIQVSEGKILNDNSKKIVAGSSLLTQFEMGILIAIGLVIMVLVFESSSVFSKSAREQSLN
jgi:hypothetical protein